MVKEIGQAEIKNPDGYVGNLTDEQDKKLREAWKTFFGIIESAKGSGGGGGGGEGGDEGMVDDPKKAGIAKDDNAKEEAKKQEEKKAQNELIEQYGQDALADAFWRFVKLDDPDTCMLRFLRARKWDVERAVAMLAGCMKWRLDTDIESLVEGGDLGNSAKIEKWMEQETSGKTYAHGASIEEHPTCYIHVRKHFTKGQPPESMQKFISYSMECFRLLLVPPNDKVILFFDLDGFGLSNMDWGSILYIVKCLEAYFPESLHTLIIYKAPWIFSGIWKILAPLLDPVVRSKVVFMKTPKECAHLLPADRLVEELGGDVEFDWGKRFIEPSDGENDLQKDSEEREKRKKAYRDLAKEYEEITRKWADGSSDKSTLEKRRLLVKKLRVAQFEQDPYWRGKTQLHRDGTVDGQGIVRWLYKLKSGDAVRHIIGRKHCAATLKREIKEMEEDGKSSADVEKKSDEAIAKQDWTTLYGSEEIAYQLEGERVNGKTPEPGQDIPKAAEVLAVPASANTGEAAGQSGGGQSASKEGKSDSKGEKEAAAGGAAAGAAAGGGAAAAAASSEKEAFVDAPVADKKTVEKAESKDHVAVPHDDKASKTGVPINGDASTDAQANGNGSADQGQDSSNNKDTSSSAQDKKAAVKEKAVDAPKAKMDALGKKFTGLMNKVKS